MSLIEKFECGDVVENRYHLDIKIHEGRWGDIYRGTDRLNDRPVAIRFFPITDSGPDDFDRFEAHARELSGMTAPTVVTPADHGMDREIPYLVYRWAAGQDLQDRLAERGGLDRQNTLKVVERLLDGLARTHDSRLTHGLIRPVKIVVDDLDGDDPLVKLVDFQIWRFFEWARGKDAFDESNLSRRIVRYTSPEVLEDHRVKPSTDIYAVGLVTIELLTGQPAFDDNNRVALIAQQMSNESAELADNADAGETLRTFIDRLVAKDESDRFRTAGEALDFLRDNKEAILSEPSATGADEADADAADESPADEEPAEQPEPPQQNEQPDEQPAPDPNDELFEGDPSSMQSLSDGDSFDEQSDSFDEQIDDQSDDDLFGEDEPLFDDDGDFGKFHGGDDDDDTSSSSPSTRPSNRSRPGGVSMNDSSDDRDEELDFDPSIADEIGTGKQEQILTSPSEPRGSLTDDRPSAAISAAGSRPAGPRGPSGPPTDNANNDISLPIAAALAIGMLALIVGAIGFIAFSGDDSATDPATTEAVAAQDDQPQIHVIEIHTDPPAQRVQTSVGDEGMSPLVIEVTEDQFPVQIRARKDADNIQDRTVEEPTDEIVFEFSD